MTAHKHAALMLQHALEEALDMANYLQAAISKLDEEGAENENRQ